jgi:hypothetical protein
MRMWPRGGGQRKGGLSAPCAPVGQAWKSRSFRQRLKDAPTGNRRPGQLPVCRRPVLVPGWRSRYGVVGSANPLRSGRHLSGKWPARGGGRSVPRRRYERLSVAILRTPGVLPTTLRGAVTRTRLHQRKATSPVLTWRSFKNAGTVWAQDLSTFSASKSLRRSVEGAL